MRLGLQVEGYYDVRPLKIIIKRVFREVLGQVVEESDVIHEWANGTISKTHIKNSLTNFEAASCSGAIFIKNNDCSRNECTAFKRMVREQATHSSYLPTAVGCPYPEFEIWFLDEQSVLKKALGYDGDANLPHSDLDAKEQVKMLFDEHPDVTKSIEDWYVEISEELDIAMLTGKNLEFKKFVKEIRSLANAIETG